MNNNILIISFLIIIHFLASCNNEKSKNRRILKELNQGAINSENFSEFIRNKDILLESKNSEELTNIGSTIYLHIGFPISKQDTHRLNIAIEYFEKALIINRNNRNAYRNIVKILMSMKKWEKGLQKIDEWLISGNPHYYDHMLKGFIYEILDKHNNSLDSFKAALKSFEKNNYKSSDVKNRIQKAIIYSFLYGQNAGMSELDKVIDETGDSYATIFRETIMKDFNKKEYIYEYVLKKPKQLEKIDQ